MIKLIVCVFILSLLFTVSACGRNENKHYERQNDEVSLFEYYQALSDEMYNTFVPLMTDVFFDGLTRADLLYDLDYLYTTLANNFPYFNAIYRRLGVDMDELFVQLRQHVANANPNTIQTPGVFANRIHYRVIRHGQPIGHLAIFRLHDVHIHHLIDRIHILSSIKLQYEIFSHAPFLYELNNSATRSLYGLTDADFAMNVFDTEYEVFVVPNNIVTYIIKENRIAYVRIHSMHHNNVESDRYVLLDFFHEIADYEHLIIDIQGNGGGSGAFFTELVMGPNIMYPMRVVQYMFFMGGAHSMRLLSNFNDYGAEGYGTIQPLTDGIISQFYYFHLDDIDMLHYYARSITYIVPTHYERIFQGKIWLLVDEHSFSAADHALTVSNYTGFATSVGVATTGGGGGTTPFLLALPNTGIVIQYAAAYGIDAMGRGNYEYGTHPMYVNRPGMGALETVLEMIYEKYAAFSTSSLNPAE